MLLFAGALGAYCTKQHTLGSMLKCKRERESESKTRCVLATHLDCGAQWADEGSSGLSGAWFVHKPAWYNSLFTPAVPRRWAGPGRGGSHSVKVPKAICEDMTKGRAKTGACSCSKKGSQRRKSYMFQGVSPDLKLL